MQQEHKIDAYQSMPTIVDTIVYKTDSDRISQIRLSEAYLTLLEVLQCSGSEWHDCRLSLESEDEFYPLQLKQYQVDAIARIITSTHSSIAIRTKDKYIRIYSNGHTVRFKFSEGTGESSGTFCYVVCGTVIYDTIRRLECNRNVK